MVQVSCYLTSPLICIYVPYAGISELGVRTFRAKIGTDNVPSLKLFQQKLSFLKVETYHTLDKSP